MKSLKNGQRGSVAIFTGVPLLPKQVLATLYWHNGNYSFDMLKKSIKEYTANKHDNHPDILYQKCNHEELPPRKWIKIGELSHFTAIGK